MSTVDDFLVPADSDRFESIPYNKQDQSELPDYARGKVLNRYGDILPNPRTRVHLTQLPDDRGSDYINANFVTNFFKNKAWIASQGPTQRTLAAFVRMLWEYKVPAVVMLTRLKEGTKAKCEPYFPAKLNATIAFERIEVTLKKSERKDGYVENVLMLSRGAEKRIVTQFWYTSWPDHGVPTNDEGEIFTREMILLVLTVRAHRKKLGNSTAPFVVHCSAGVGRTGAFIAIDHAIDAYKQRVRLDLNDVVVTMRQCRMAMIQHTVQYCFVHAAARDYILGKLELKAAKHKGEAAHTKAGRGGSVSAEVLTDTKIGDLFTISEDFTNPDGNDGVLLLKKGDLVELLEKSDVWWWMRREGEEGWVLPSSLSPVKAKGPPPPTPAENPFVNGSSHHEDTNVNNPFQSHDQGKKPAPAPKPRARTASNPFQTEHRKSNPFEAGGTKTANPFSGKDHSIDSTNNNNALADTENEGGLENVFMSDMALIEARMAKLKSAPTSVSSLSAENDITDDELPPIVDETLHEDAEDALHMEMQNDLNHISERIDALKSPELPSNPEVEEEAGPFYSLLQPYTYVLEDGVVKTLFDPAVVVEYSPPANLPQDRVRNPGDIVGPAIVSHDNTWRLINKASEYANARVQLTLPDRTSTYSDTEC